MPSAREWQSPEGLRRAEVVGDGRIAIRTDGQPFAQILPASQLDAEIRRDEANYKSRRAARERAEEETRVEAAEHDLHGFTDGLPQVKAAKIAATLYKQQGFSGKVMRRHKFIEQAVADGAVVEGHRTGRRFVMAGGSFYTERDVTKIGLDYAEYLIRQGAF